MHYQEGLRRIGLVLGFVGASIALIAAYDISERERDLKERTERFERLLRSSSVQKAIDTRQTDVVRVNSAEGVRTVYVDTYGNARAMTMSSGEYLEPYKYTPPATLFALPIMGFVLPWGFCQILSWVLQGFAKAT